MTVQEKRVHTEKCMRLVRENYRTLKYGRTMGDAGRRQKMHALRRWLAAIEEAYASLRQREGKSAARARHDWLVARAIELTVFDGGTQQTLCSHLSGPRMLNRRYVGAIEEAALKAIQQAAEEAGLLG